MRAVLPSDAGKDAPAGSAPHAAGSPPTRDWPAVPRAASGIHKRNAVPQNADGWWRASALHSEPHTARRGRYQPRTVPRLQTVHPPNDGIARGSDGMPPPCEVKHCAPIPGIPESGTQLNQVLYPGVAHTLFTIFTQQKQGNIIDTARPAWHYVETQRMKTPLLTILLSLAALIPVTSADSLPVLQRDT